MLVAGVIEVAAGILVAVKPRSLRDLGLALGAFALWRLALEFAE